MNRNRTPPNFNERKAQVNDWLL